MGARRRCALRLRRQRYRLGRARQLRDGECIGRRRDFMPMPTGIVAELDGLTR